MKLWNIIFAASALCLTTQAATASVMDFDDLVIWAGSGANEAALVLDWDDSKSPLAWGYRWDGTASGEDMIRAIAAEDPNFYVALDNSFPTFGNFVSGFGYDRDGDGFPTSSIATFDPDGVFVGAGNTDGVALDPDDSYRESTTSFEFWEYLIGTGNPYDGGMWGSSPTGISSRTLNDGDWDGFFFPGFASQTPGVASAAGATVPEPGTFAAFVVGGAGFLMARRKKKAN